MKKWSLAIGALAVGALAVGRAWASLCLIAVQLVLAPTGFGVEDSAANSSGYYPMDLATSPSANWNLVAYSNPANEAYLNPFTQSTSGTVTQYSTTSSSTAAQGMAVTLTHDSASNLSAQTLSQTGLGSGGCATGEFDLFVAANAIPPNDPAYPSGYVNGAQNPTLDHLSAIVISGTVTLQSQSSIATPGACTVNQGSMIYSLVFSDATSSQTLFYQLDLNYFCYHGSDASFNSFCDAEVPSMNYFFTGSGGIWGIDDPITNYSNAETGAPYALLQGTIPLSVEINFLPRVAYLIANGQDGLDTTLSHWKLGSFYYGQHTWGSASLASVWSSTNFGPSILIQP